MKLQLETVNKSKVKPKTKTTEIQKASTANIKEVDTVSTAGVIKQLGTKITSVGPILN